MAYFYDFIRPSGQQVLQISGNSAIKSEAIGLYITQPDSSWGFTQIKWIQMENGL